MPSRQTFDSRDRESLGGVSSENQNRAHFLTDYLNAFDSIEGWFSSDAALMLMAYNQLIQDYVSGDVLEIGVFNGLSAIAIATLRGPRNRFYAADLFDYGGDSTTSMVDRFLGSMRRFFDDLSFLEVRRGPSSALLADDLGREFSFCHIDGDHSADATYTDLELCCEVLLPGGLLAVDDFFNWTQPGVSEGTIKFQLDHPGTLKPLAIGFNKVLFQRLPAPFEINVRFAETFANIPCAYAAMMGLPVLVFSAGIVKSIDLAASAPGRLVEGTAPRVVAAVEALQQEVIVKVGKATTIPVRVTNLSTRPLSGGELSPFRASYHLLSQAGELLQFDNQRTFLRRTLLPGERQELDVALRAPDLPGRYRAQIDLVWEGVTWLGTDGSTPATVAVTVE